MRLYYPPRSLDLASGLLLPGDGAVQLLADSVPLAAWDGLLASGKPASPGIYYLRAEYPGPAGLPSAVMLPLQVLPVRPGFDMAVYNAAGEKVRGWSLPASAQDFHEPRFSSRTLALPLSEGDACGLMVDVGGACPCWDGRNDLGREVSAGVYLLRVRGLSSRGEQVSWVVSLAVLTRGAAAGGAACLYPNPLRAQGPRLRLSLEDPPPGELRADVYELSGRRLGSLSLLGRGYWVWEQQPDLAPGVYALLLRPVEPRSIPARLMKFAVAP